MSTDRNVEKFVRQDNNPGAVLNTDKNGLLAYKRQKVKALDTERIKADIEELRCNVCRNNDLLTKQNDLLTQLIEKMKNDNHGS